VLFQPAERIARSSVSQADEEIDSNVLPDRWREGQSRMRIDDVAPKMFGDFRGRAGVDRSINGSLIDY
jgi:hypothetical protein